MKCGVDLSSLPPGAIINSAVMEIMGWKMTVMRKDPYETSYKDWKTGETISYMVVTETIPIYTERNCIGCVKHNVL
jgi:hypothetical protein